MSGVAPFGLGGSLDAPITTGHDAQVLAVGLQELGSSKLRLGDAGSAEVLEERDVSRGIAANEIDISVAIPIEPDWRGERPKLHLISLLLEILRRQE